MALLGLAFFEKRPVVRQGSVVQGKGQCVHARFPGCADTAAYNAIVYHDIHRAVTERDQAFAPELPSPLAVFSNPWDTRSSCNHRKQRIMLYSSTNGSLTLLNLIIPYHGLPGGRVGFLGVSFNLVRRADLHASHEGKTSPL